MATHMHGRATSGLLKMKYVLDITICILYIQFAYHGNFLYTYHESYGVSNTVML